MRLIFGKLAFVTVFCVAFTFAMNASALVCGGWCCNPNLCGSEPPICKDDVCNCECKSDDADKRADCCQERGGAWINSSCCYSKKYDSDGKCCDSGTVVDGTCCRTNYNGQIIAGQGYPCDSSDASDYSDESDPVDAVTVTVVPRCYPGTAECWNVGALSGNVPHPFDSSIHWESPGAACYCCMPGDDCCAKKRDAVCPYAPIPSACELYYNTFGC